MRYNDAVGEAMSRNSRETTSAEWLAGLSAAEASQFTRVLQAYRAAGGNAGEDEKLARLAQRYTIELVRQAIDQAKYGPVNIERLQTELERNDPLFAKVVDICVKERIEPVATGLNRDVGKDLANLLDEFDNLEWWQEAVRRAARCNRRRLSTVERILRDRQETGSWEPPWEQKAAEKQRGKAGKGGQGPQERGTQEIRRTQEKRGTIRWDEEELAKLRAQLPPDEWD